MDKLIKSVTINNQGNLLEYGEDVINRKDYKSIKPIYAPRDISDRRDQTEALSNMIREFNKPFPDINHLIKIYTIGKGYQGKPIIEPGDRYAYITSPKKITIMKSSDSEIILSQTDKIKRGGNTIKYKVDLPYVSKFKPRGVQGKYIRETFKLIDKGANRILIEEEPGGGKTWMATKILSKLSERYVVLVKGGYVAKWVADVEELHGITPFVIKGRSSFLKLIKLKSSGEMPLVYILSTNTLDAYNRKYHEGTNYLEGVMDEPTDLMEFLEANIILSDESHQYFSSTMEAFLQLDPRLIIALSGTYSSSHRHRERAMQQFFPLDERLNFGKYEKYIRHIEYTATLSKDENTLARLMEAALSRGRGYSHNALEQLMVYNSNMVRIDLLHIKALIDRYLYNNPVYVKGHKFIIFVASIAYATILETELAKCYNNVKRYVGKDDYDNVQTGEIIITNVAKAGTAIDIKNLLVVLMLDLVGNKEGLTQVSARLRKEYKDNESVPYEKTFITKYINGLDRHTKHKYLVNKVLRHKFTNQVILTDGVNLNFKV